MYQQNQNKFYPYTHTVPTPPAQEQPEKRRSNRRFAGVLLCACLVTSSVAGFGGGYLAMSRQPVQQAAASSVQQTAEPAPAAVADAAPGADGMSVSQVVNAVSGSVVEIGTEVQTTNPFFGQTSTAQAAGSGVILSEDGYIITNHHVIENAQKIQVRLKDGTSYPAELVGSDPQTDIAVIKVEATGLQAAKIGSSAGLQVGDETIAIGNPLGTLGGTVTNGIVSATGREVTIDGNTMSLLQTNAAINPGNSGGGLFNNQAELIGIVTAKSSGTGIEGLGYAVPIDMAYKVASDLMQHGYVTGRGELGISVLNISDTREAFLYRVPQTGVYIAAVENGSAAQRAGLQVGDGILAVNGEEISSLAQLRTQLNGLSAGEQITLTLLRDGKQQEVPVVLQEEVPEGKLV